MLSFPAQKRQRTHNATREWRQPGSARVGSEVLFQWLMVDCFFLPQWAASTCVDDWTTGHFEQRGNESGSNGFASGKVIIPAFGWDELVLLCSHVALDRNVGISVVSFDRRRVLNHSLDAWQVSPPRNER